MRIFITGITGQLGRILQHILTEQGETVLETPRWDITDHSIVQKISTLRPDIIIRSVHLPISPVYRLRLPVVQQSAYLLGVEFYSFF